MPVEHQFVLSPHRVDEGETDEVVGGARGQHLLAELRLAHVVGRRVDRNDQLRPREGLARGGARGIPDVLADIGGHSRVAHQEDGGFRARLEVAVLIEHAIVGQVLLVVGAGMGAVVEHGRRVEDVVALVHVAEHGGQPLALLHHVSEGAQVRLDEGGLEQEIFGRIAGQRQLGKGHEVAARAPGATHPVHHQPRIGLDGSHRRIDLGQPHPYPSHGRILNHAPGPHGQVQAKQDEDAADHRERREGLTKPPHSQQGAHHRLDVDEQGEPGRLHSLEGIVPHEVAEGGDDESEIQRAPHRQRRPPRSMAVQPLEGSEGKHGYQPPDDGPRGHGRGRH